MDTELSKTDENCGDHSTTEQGMEKTHQSLEPCEKPEDKQSKSMQDTSNEILEKKPDKVAETPGEEENPKQKGQKKKPRNPFMPQVAAKNKTTQNKNGNQNGDSGSDLAESKGPKKSLMEWLDEFRLSETQREDEEDLDGLMDWWNTVEQWEDMPKSDNMTEKEEAKLTGRSLTKF